MSEIKLSERLQTIFNMVPTSIVADIGADHGKLIISLYEKGIISCGYAVENKKGPYERLCKAIQERDLLDKIIPLFSDGIIDLPDIVSTLIIAGMGGGTIVDILTKGHEHLPNINTIIVDAHTDVPFLRKKVSDMGFIIAEEKMVQEDGIYYEIIKFIRSDQAYYNDSELEFGPILSKEKGTLFKAKYNSRKAEIEKLLKLHLPKDKVIALTKEKERIERVL